MTSHRHHWLEDAQALLTGTLLFALAIVLFRQAGLLTGGTAGLTFLAHYATGLSFGLLYFLINIPFYIFGLKALGKAFTLKTFCWARKRRLGFCRYAITTVVSPDACVKACSCRPRPRQNWGSACLTSRWIAKMVQPSAKRWPMPSWWPTWCARTPRCTQTRASRCGFAPDRTR